MKRNSTLAGSWDVTKLKEGGYSATPYNGYSGLNLGFYTAQAIAFFLNGSNGSGGLSYAADVAGDESFYNAASQQKLSILSLSGGLQFIQKGAKPKDEDAKIRLNYLELLIDLTYQYPIGDEYIYVGMGPYLAYGIGGHISATGFSSPAFGKSYDYKRFDAGPQVMIGYIFSFNLNVHVGYELGIVNTAQPGLDITSKNSAFNVNVGYNIGSLFDSGAKK